jgi:hypothetical protein
MTWGPEAEKAGFRAAHEESRQPGCDHVSSGFGVANFNVAAKRRREAGANLDKLSLSPRGGSPGLPLPRRGRTTAAQTAGKGPKARESTSLRVLAPGPGRTGRVPARKGFTKSGTNVALEQPAESCVSRCESSFGRHLRAAICINRMHGTLLGRDANTSTTTRSKSRFQGAGSILPGYCRHLVHATEMATGATRI